MTTQIPEMDRSIYEKADEHKIRFATAPGVTEEAVRKISQKKQEPEWMLKLRLRALELYHKTPIPTWGPDLSHLDLEQLTYYVEPEAENAKSWDDVPEEIKQTFERLGIPQAEQQALAGVGGQYDSSTVYHNLKKEYEDQGVIFEDMDSAVQKYPELVKKYFMTKCIPITDHKFIMLHAAVWSGGTFIYVPEGAKVDIPLQAYFRMNQESSGQFEHTLIIAEKNAEVHYIEGCSAPKFSTNSLHAGCVELHAHENSFIKYSSIENWSKNTYNLNTKRAIVHKNARVDWVNGNMGSGITMLYPSSILLGENAQSRSIGMAFSGEGQNQDTGTKMIHIGKNSSSLIQSKSVSKDGGISTYRGLVKFGKMAKGAISSVECDALMVDNDSISNTYPEIEIDQEDSQITHEAKVGKIGEQELLYLMSRGMSEEEAKQLVVAGFINPIAKELPFEYAAELNKLIELEMEGSIG